MNGPLPPEVAADDEAHTRRALLHVLEDLQRERDAIQGAHQQWIETVDAVRDPLMVHDADGRIVRVNRAYTEWAGIGGYKELIGRRYWECFPKRSGPLACAGGDALEFVLESGETFVCRSFPIAGVGQTLHLFEDVTQRRKAKSELRWKTAFLEAMVRSSLDGLLVVDPQGKKIFQNRHFIDLWKIPGELAADPDDRRQLQYVADMLVAPKQFADKVAYLYSHPEETSRDEIALKDGRILDRYSAPVTGADGTAYGRIWSFRDVTEQKASERRVQMLNTLYATLSAINHAIVQSKTRREICERIVRISTEIGLWHGAWVGFADPQTKRIVPEAWSPGMRSYMDNLAVSVDPEVPEGQGPTGVAVRSGVPYFCNDVASDPLTAPWRSFAESSGTSSVASIPLNIAGSPPGVVNLYSREKEIFTPEVRELVIEMGDDITFALETLEKERQREAAESALLEHQVKLRHSLEGTVEAIAATVETRDPYTAGHQRRVADLARAIGREMGLAEDVQEGLHFGALIHDLGKVQIPAEILSKPTRLSKLEFELIKTHPQAGYDIVKSIEFPWPVADMVHQHHERLDGSGYPQGLKGDAIALEARVLAVADVVEAMASHRPYRPGLGIEAALKEIEAKRGIWFEPAAVDACLRLFREKRFAL